tara:strand:+ start:507 stop:1679 length:1173 start_codon:yes stop_codon:yes gene_type:complete
MEQIDSGISAIVVAAGRGTRFGGTVSKQYRLIEGEPILAKAIKPFLNNPKINDVVVVVSDHDNDLFERYFSHLTELKRVVGGDTRQESVRLGLEALILKAPRFVLIHDGARPFVSPKIIDKLIEQLKTVDAVVPILPIHDTLKKIDGSKIVETLDRSQLFRAQTPQAFKYELIMKAHRMNSAGAETDDARLIELSGGAVATILGDERMFKITQESDYSRALMLSNSEFQTRIGSGYDVHRLGAGTGVKLCGIEIPFSKSLIGHSDADVALHALTDAILGAISMGDIGEHFPPNDPAWAGQSSDRFVSFAVETLRSKNGELINVDLTIICEAPRITPFKKSMTTKLSKILQIPTSSLNIKATTTEGLGSLGRGEGIAAQASVAVRLPHEIE